jgi:hypothetical protein
MQVSQALIPVRAGIIVPVMAAVGLSLLAAWAAFGGARGAFDARCETWDGAATAALAALIADRNPGVEHYLGDAVFRLRRARTYCRYGLVGLARLDYKALLDGRHAGYRLRSETSTVGSGRP